MASDKSEVSDLVKLLLDLVVTLRLKWEAVVSWVSLEASICPLALGSVAADKLLLLLFRSQ